MTYKAYAKVNIFLKIVGTRGDYHEICSRFILVDTLFDTLCFVPKKNDVDFELSGDFGCELEQNTIYKAFTALCEAGFKEGIKEIFSKNALHVEKNIPSFAGLGGGSSDAATFLHMVNKKANLGLSSVELANIGLKVGADVPFFIYGYTSANVSGIGEVVEKFNEEPLSIEVFTPNIKCDTGIIYKTFRRECKIETTLANKMKELSSKTLLQAYSDTELNDLLEAALKVDKNINKYRKKDWFFSGSGSSFFRVKG